MDDDAELQLRLRHEQIRLLARNVPALVSGTLILGSGAAALLWSNQQPRELIVGWLLTLIVLSLWRLWSARRFWQDTQRGGLPAQWARNFVVASALAGLCWGSLAWLFFTPDNPLNLAVVAIVLMAILSSATQSLGPYFPSHLAFALPCALPFAARCLWSGDGGLITLGVLTAVFLIMAELFSLRIARAIEDALRLRFENESLVAQLRVEKERAESANLAKTRFLATASHDLRQPIHAMSLFVPALKALASRAEIAPRTVASIADRMQDALDTMGQLLNRLLDISRLDAGALQPREQAVPLAPLFRRVCDEVAQQVRAKRLRLHVRDGGLSVLADPGVLHTILSNLTSNAVRYTERGGVLLAARRRGDRIRIEIWDSGVGIEAHDLPHVTEEFYQAGNVRRDARQLRGFGLGLAIVKRSADLLGSQLACRSLPGRGSVFSIDLPETATPANPTPEQPPADVARPSRTVLVVDDDEQILTAMGYLLKGWGHEPLVARTLDDALACVAASGRPPELALVDMHLDNGETGVQVIEALRARLGTSLRVAIVTGDTSPSVLATIRATGVTGLHKPVDQQTLIRFIDDAA
jgi:two-component system, sensor histidine kinase